MLTGPAQHLLDHGHAHGQGHLHATTLLVIATTAIDPQVLSERKKISEESVINAIPANTKTSLGRKQITRSRNYHAREMPRSNRRNDHHIEAIGNEITTRKRSGSQAEVIGPIALTAREIEARNGMKVVGEAVVKDHAAAHLNAANATSRSTAPPAAPQQQRHHQSRHVFLKLSPLLQNRSSDLNTDISRQTPHERRVRRRHPPQQRRHRSEPPRLLPPTPQALQTRSPRERHEAGIFPPHIQP